MKFIILSLLFNVFAEYGPGTHTACKYGQSHGLQGVSKYCLLKMLTKETLLAIDCKHVLRAVSVLTFGSFTLYNYNFTVISFLDVSKTLFNEVFESIYGYFLSR